MLEIGPTTATKNSSPGVVASAVRFETPPKMNSVMLSTFRPRLRATSEWLNSCTSTDTNNSSAAMTPSAQYETAPALGSIEGK
jgi:hypothetical protein